MNRKRLLSFKAWLGITIVAISATIYAPILFLVYQESENLFNSEIEDVHAVISSSLQNSLSYAIETGNSSLIQTTIDSVIPINFIYSVTVLDEQGSALAFKKNPIYDGLVINELKSNEIAIFSRSTIDSSMIENDLLTDNLEDNPAKNRLEYNAKKLVGYLHITSTTYLTKKRSYNVVLQSIALSLLLAVISFLIFLAVLRSMNKNIADLIESAKRLAKGERGVMLSEKSNVREISIFASSLNAVAAHLEKAWQEIDSHEEVFELKNSILQIAAHELRTPIASLKTYLDIAMTFEKNNRHSEAATTLKQCFSDIESLDRHVTSILALSALEQGVLRQNNNWINSKKLFEDLNRQFKVKCNSKIELSWNCESMDGNDYELLIDYDLVSIVLSNAIDNAIKYTERGLVDVRYQFKDNQLQVEVRDTGIGLTEDQIDTLMTKPKQLQNDIKRKRDGWGIGIATMHRFTDFLNGSMSIKSAIGFGTRVLIAIPAKGRPISKDNTLNTRYSSAGSGTDHADNAPLIYDASRPYLPLYEDASNRPEDFVAVQDGGEYRISSLTNERPNSPKDGINVLLIDNEPQHLEQMKVLLSEEFLRRSDVQSTFCVKPIDAIRELEENHYDLLIIDYHMPEIDGLQLLVFIDEQENLCRESYKVILTADANIPAEIKTKMDLLSDRILSKGLTGSEVRNLIRQVSMKAVN